MWSTRNKSKGSRFNLEEVVNHLLGRDASLRWMYTSHGVPLKASANRRGENLAITFAHRQLAQASGDLTILPLLSTSPQKSYANIHTASCPILLCFPEGTPDT